MIRASKTCETVWFFRALFDFSVWEGTFHSISPMCLLGEESQKAW